MMYSVERDTLKCRLGGPAGIDGLLQRFELHTALFEFVDDTDDVPEIPA